MMPRPDLERLVAQYRGTDPSPTEWEKAELESKMWELSTAVERKTMNRRLWVSELLGIPQSTVACHGALLASGDDSEILWVKLANNEVTLSTAAKLIVEAREWARSKQTTVKLALEEVLRRYYSERTFTSIVNGIPVRRRSPSRLPRTPEPAPPPPTPAAPANGAEEGAEKSFWDDFRSLVAPFVASKLKSADPIVAEALWREFERDLKILLGDFQRRIYRAARATNEQGKVALRTVSRTKVREACEALDLPVPHRDGEPVDLKAALSQKWKMAKAYHPDANGGLQTESTREKLKAALDAYDCLEQYNASLSIGVITP